MKIVQISESEFSVQGHGVHTAFVETVNGLSATAGNRVIKNSFHAADIRHIHTVGPYSLAQLLFAKGKKIVSAHVVPKSFVGSLVGTKYWLRLATWYLVWFYNRADAVIAVSDETKHQLEAIGVRRPIKVIYNMIDTSRYHFLAKDRQKSRRDLGIDPTKTVVLGNGQVQPRKRVDTFINIAKRLPDMQFIWIGGMPFGKAAASYSDMQKLVDSAPSNVKFTGVVDLEKVRQYFATGDIFVMTSDQETFGLAIIEAAASGLPVVLRDIADYDHTFRNDALVCQESEFVEAVTKLAGDRSYYEQMQAHSASIARRFDSRSVTDQLLSLYRSCLEK